MRSLRVRSPSKINLYLAVLGRRPDGYHNIETVFQAINLYDELIITEAVGEARLQVPGLPGLEGEHNLVMRVVRWYEQEFGRPLPVHMRLIKAIPEAAGLGGGSGNAAAALLGLRTLFDLPVGDDALQRAATLMGADVPFFLAGGTAVGEGIGDKLTPIALPMDYEILLVNPGFTVSTKAVYETLAPTLTPESSAGRVFERLRGLRAVETLLRNDLQPVAEALYPDIGEMLRHMANAGLEHVLMSGSGPSVFGIMRDREASRVSERLPDRWRYRITGPTALGVVID